MSEPIGTPEPESGLDIADDNTMIDARTAKQLRCEAQSLRHRLREAEAGRQAAEDARAGDLARLASFEKREIERAAADVLADPADLWHHVDEVTTQSFVDEKFGEVVPDAVRDAARALVESSPHLAKRATPPPTDRPVEGLRPGASPEQTKPAASSWATALRGY